MATIVDLRADMRADLRALANSNETGPLVEWFNAKFKLVWPRPRQGEPTRGFHSSNFRLDLSTVCGIRRGDLSDTSISG